MKLTNEIVKDFVEQNPKLVRRSQSKALPELYVLKYSKHAFYSGTWPEPLLDMRGLVVDADYNPVVMPFRKIFNRFEQGKDFPRDQEVFASRKVNGFMAAMTYYPKLGEVIVSTTGSLDSEYVEIATDVLLQTTDMRDIVIGQAQSGASMTFLFEIVSDRDMNAHPIAEASGAYLLAARAVEWNGATMVGNLLNHCGIEGRCPRPETKLCRWSDLVEEVQTCTHEGFVAYACGDPENQAIKLKSPFYSTLKKVGRMDLEKLKKAIQSDTLKDLLPAQHAKIGDEIWKHFGLYSQLNDHERFAFLAQRIR